MAYLDHNATSPLRPEARRAMERAIEAQGNPSSVHRSGRAARAIVEEAREDVAALVGALPGEVIFTSSGTEANALALWGAARGAAGTREPIKRLFVSAIEHDSIIATAAAIAQSGVELAIIPVTPAGVVDLDVLSRLFAYHPGRALVAVMAANNETGVIQPVAEIAGLTHDAGALLLVDAVQACGKMATDFTELGADYLTLSAHKLGGPQGVGALVVRDGAPLAAQLVGGGQEKYRRAGTENVIGIAGFGAVAQAAQDTDVSHPASLRNRFEDGLRSRFADVLIFGAEATRLGNTSNFALPGIAAETAIIALDLDGVMVSSGAACSSGKVRSSHVLMAMGVLQDLRRSALRVSFGWNSVESDVDRALDSLEKLSARVAARRAA